jgi:hypothetical protein
MDRDSRGSFLADEECGSSQRKTNSVSEEEPEEEEEEEESGESFCIGKFTATKRPTTKYKSLCSMIR